MPRQLIAITMLAVLASTPAVAQDGDAEDGAKVFRRCQACHAVGEDAQNKVGPQLNDLFGRQPGSLEGFNYSDAMVEFGQDKVWDVEHLTAFLRNPRETVPGTKMAFPGLRKDEEIADVIAFLAEQEEGGTETEQ
ncbi:c-type cytochrome [Lutibaculum baratangense]|uniref:Cytochrome c2 n=1 Tax=Lutibaculum baratangense AMV1 TaxID=631454 RepID=V4TMS1_9HYPH|nr:cytochrome c family protein [Lutibaculum baratangense]ESR27043.1 Cytochrome c2 [Lutibaculum baratangense AMV1]